MKVLFDQIPLDEMSVSMTMNGAVLPIMVFTLSLPRNKVSNPSYFPERYKTTFKEFMVQHLYLSANSFHENHR
jgi:methylmalonyl-CoA mutase